MQKIKESIALIISERERQISVEGYDCNHDDAHVDGELASAAIAHLIEAGTYTTAGHKGSDYWPWEDSYKPAASQLQNLVKAGALVAAEIDRVLRSLDA